MKGEYISIETLEIMASIEKENEHLNMQLNQALKDYEELQTKIDKALKELEYVLPVYTTPIGQVIHLEDKLASIERAIKILGDKE